MLSYRRIHAMELCETLPKAKIAIAEGKLSLTTAASLQNYFEKENECALPQKAKEELLECVQGKSKRECEKIFYPEKLGISHHFIADEETMQDLKRLSELMAISSSDMAALIKKIARIARKAIDPELKKTRTLSRTFAASPEKLKTSERALWENPKREYISVAKKTALWRREGSRCAFVDPGSGRRCSAKFGLQIDHIVPVACGGSSELENLRLLCFAHNHLAAQRVFGKAKMESCRRGL